MRIPMIIQILFLILAFLVIKHHFIPLWRTKMSFYVEPKLTEDTTLKRARVDLDSQTSAVRVTGVTPTDLSPITDALGDPDDAAWSGVGNATVISLLKGISNIL